MFKYSLSGTLQGSWTIDSANGSPTGITIDPAAVDHIWIVDSADAAVYRYNSAVSRTSGNQNSASMFKLASSNTNAQGIADPPPGGLGSASVGPIAARVETASDKILSPAPLQSAVAVIESVFAEWTGSPSFGAATSVEHRNASGNVRTAGLAGNAPQFVELPSDMLLANELNGSHRTRIVRAGSSAANPKFDDVDTLAFGDEEFECVAEDRVLQAAL